MFKAKRNCFNLNYLSLGNARNLNGLRNFYNQDIFQKLKKHSHNLTKPHPVACVSKHDALEITVN